MVVLLQPYISQAVLVIVGDYFFFKAGKKYVGKNATRLGFIILFFSKQHTDYLIRCFTNAVEEILSVIAFYYFLDQKNKFNLRTVILTTTITLSFMMRNTSPIGWIPLLAIKVLREDALLPFLLAGLFVALPVIGLTIVVDTLYFLGAVDGERWVLTSYNFMRRNILEGLSEYFGSDPASKYLLGFAPETFTLVYPIVLIGCVTHVQRKWNQRQSPYLTYYCVFYVLVFSFIPHKELRFLMPIIPFAMLIAGEQIVQIFRQKTT